MDTDTEDGETEEILISLQVVTVSPQIMDA